ncbi:MAG: hypothetical protein JO250_10290 [Armatimonadetes bacterium]|nr:hypothetical protein [Armatimonadota bacterium]
MAKMVNVSGIPSLQIQGIVPPDMPQGNIQVGYGFDPAFPLDRHGSPLQSIPINPDGPANGTIVQAYVVTTQQQKLQAYNVNASFSAHYLTTNGQANYGQQNTVNDQLNTVQLLVNAFIQHPIVELDGTPPLLSAIVSQPNSDVFRPQYGTYVVTQYTPVSIVAVNIQLTNVDVSTASNIKASLAASTGYGPFSVTANADLSSLVQASTATEQIQVDYQFYGVTPTDQAALVTTVGGLVSARPLDLQVLSDGLAKIVDLSPDHAIPQDVCVASIVNFGYSSPNPVLTWDDIKNEFLEEVVTEYFNFQDKQAVVQKLASGAYPAVLVGANRLAALNDLIASNSILNFKEQIQKYHDGVNQNPSFSVATEAPAWQSILQQNPISPNLYQLYEIVEVPPLGGATGQSVANAINGGGQVTGSATGPTGSMEAIVYAPGNPVPRAIGPVGAAASEGTDINESGEVVGTYTPSGGGNAAGFYYDGSSAFPILYTGGGLNRLRINNASSGAQVTVVGEIQVNAGGIANKAFSWSPGDSSVNVLAAFDGNCVDWSARDVNDADIIVGVEEVVGPGSPDTGTYAGTAWNTTSGGIVGGLKTPGVVSTELDFINAAAGVAGVASFSNASNYGFIYSFSTHSITDTIQPLPGTQVVEIGDMNGENIVAGTSKLAPPNPYPTLLDDHAFIFVPATLNPAGGSGAIDLNDLILQTTPPWFLTGATGINDGGQVCGNGWHGAPRAFILVPQPYSLAPSPAD